MDIQKGIESTVQLIQNHVDITEYYSHQSPSVNGGKTSRRPNFLERMKEDKKNNPTPEILKYSCLPPLENSEISLQSSGNNPIKPPGDLTFPEARQKSPVSLSYPKKSADFEPGENQPVLSSQTQRVEPTYINKSSEPAETYPKIGTEGASGLIEKLNLLEIQELKQKNNQLKIELAEARTALKSEKARVEEISASHIKLEELAKKLEEIAIRERQRANKLEDELISQSSRKNPKKNSFSSPNGSSFSSGKKKFTEQPCKNCYQLDVGSEQISRMAAQRLEQDYLKI